MRKLLTILIVLLSTIGAFAGTCGNGYTYSLKFTVPAANNPTADQTNFPVALAFNGAHFYNSYYLPDLKTVANGGKIQNTANNSIGVSGPADLIFCDAASAGNALKFEVSGYSATTGPMEAYVKIATLSHTTANNFWMFYGNVSVVTTQQDLSLWTDAGYSEVCHLSDGTSLNVGCSKSAGTEVNHGATAATGAIDGAANLTAASAQYIDLGSPVTLSTMTGEVWINPTSFPAAGCTIIFSNANGSSNGYDLLMGVNNTITTCQANGLAFINTENAGANYNKVYQTTTALSTWNQYVFTATGTTRNLYLNGVAEAGGTSTGTPASIGTSGTNLTIGKRPTTSANYYDGVEDELRISPSVRSADWIAATYANEYSPSAFALANTPTPATGLRIVQYAPCDSAPSTANTCTLPANFTSGNLLLVVSANSDSTKCTAPNINTLFSDTLSSTFTYAIGITNFAGGVPGACVAFTAPGSSGAEAVTAVSAGTASQSMVIYEIAGITSPSLDVTSTNTGGASGTLSTGSATATTANSILVCAFGGSSSSSPMYTSSISPSSGFMLNRNSAVVGGATKGGTAFIQFTGSGSKSCTFTFGGPGPTNTAGALAVIKYSPSGVASKRRLAQVY
jgi:hypothetical protein